jgi:hypothetical protein
MKTKIGANPGSSGLGDVTLMTAVCKHFPNLTVQLHPDYEKLAFLFKGICEKVELTVTPVHTKGLPIPNVTYSERMLREFDYWGDDTTPFIFTDSEKYIKAREKIKDIKKPIIVKYNCSKRWSHVRQYKFDYVQNEVNKWIEQGFTPIQTGISDNFTPLNGCIHIVDAHLEDIAALYKAVGLYFGTDTGDPQLMIAVGGKCVVLVPSANYPVYNPDDFLHKTNRIYRQIVPREHMLW